jgi:uncharacterized delta-60 repeat protein
MFGKGELMLSERRSIDAAMRRPSKKLRNVLVGAITAIAITGLGAAPASAASGAVDTSFGNGGYSTAPLGSWAGAVASVVQPDGKIVTAGEALVNGKYLLVSTRMNANGSLDSSYGNGGWMTVDMGGSAAGNAIALQPDGKIVIGGTGRGDGGTGPLALAAVRLKSDGSLDQSFGTGGIATVPIGSVAQATGIAIQSDGKIVLGGAAVTDHHRFVVARLNANGSIDSGFGNGGYTTFSPDGVAWGLVLQPDGRIVLAGEATSGGQRVYMAARVRSNGTPDSSFGGGGIAMIPVGSNAWGMAIARQPDGKLLVTGTAVSGSNVVATARLNTNGTLDSSFGSGGIAKFNGAGVNAMTLQSSGKILLAGVGASVVRLNANGSMDTSFGDRGLAWAQTGSSDAANGVTIQPSDGKIVLAGGATINGRIVLSVVRMQP